MDDSPSASPKLRLWPDPILTQKCRPVAPVALSDPDLTALIDDLFHTMYASYGRGLTAPQIGVLKRVFVVDVTWKEGARDPRVFINPEPLTAGETVTTLQEQCLSIPDLPMPVSRPDELDLRWTNRDGSPASAALGGLLARCVQHELDHLDGKVIFDHQTPQDRARLEADYAAR